MTAHKSNHNLYTRTKNQLTANGISELYCLLFNHVKQIISEKKAVIKKLHQTTRAARQTSSFHSSFHQLKIQLLILATLQGLYHLLPFGHKPRVSFREIRLFSSFYQHNSYLDAKLHDFCYASGAARATLRTHLS